MKAEKLKNAEALERIVVLYVEVKALKERVRGSESSESFSVEDEKIFLFQSKAAADLQRDLDGALGKVRELEFCLQLSEKYRESEIHGLIAFRLEDVRKAELSARRAVEMDLADRFRITEKAFSDLHTVQENSLVVSAVTVCLDLIRGLKQRGYSGWRRNKLSGSSL